MGGGREGKWADKEEKAVLLWWENRGKEKVPRRRGLPSFRQRGVGTKGSFRLSLQMTRAAALLY